MNGWLTTRSRFHPRTQFRRLPKRDAGIGFDLAGVGWPHDKSLSELRNENRSFHHCERKSQAKVPPAAEGKIRISLRWKSVWLDESPRIETLRIRPEFWMAMREPWRNQDR